ncbi:MAG: class I SAM-dependent methyltransferase [Candidatus Saganbacteria bacterium]|nr:class I SAM-dependent methyltransferase [Candidatus Saganbacteria bacterium]
MTVRSDFDQFYKLLIKDSIFEKKINPYSGIDSLQKFGTRKYVESGLSAPEQQLYSSFENNPGKALVIGCSSGRECVYLTKKGWKVLGIDYIEDLLKIGRNYAQQLGLNIECQNFDILKVEESSFSGKKFDFIAFTIYTLIYPKKKRQQILRVLRNHLTDKGKIVVICRGRDPEIRIKNRFLKTALKILKPSYEDGDYVRYISILHVFSEDELKEEVGLAGFCAKEFAAGDIYKYALLEKV